MIENFGMTNVQNIPGDTDFENVLNDNNFAPEKNSGQPISTGNPPFGALVSEPPSNKDKTVINEIPNALPRQMTARAWTNYERRIY